jgi:hypothetical protein
MPGRAAAPKMVYGWLLVFGFMLLSACGGGETEIVTQLSECTPGQSAACVCEGQRLGLQACGDDGTYGACDCSGFVQPEDVGVEDTGREDAGAEDTGPKDSGEQDAPPQILNECGGTTEFTEGLPGDPCGTCPTGVLVCDGADALSCMGGTEPNVCGGCKRLKHAPGDVCGDCGGAWECDGTERLKCAKEFNVCGACTTLAGTPGDSCGNGLIYACSGQRRVDCVDETTTNACGGTALLAAQPGEACGSCGEGRYQCASPDLVACVGATATPNACQGCTPLAQTPGESCGPEYVWACESSGESLVCEEDTSGPTGGQNACGGTAALGASPGDICETCGIWACQTIDPDQLVCLGGSTGLQDDPNNCGVCGNRCAAGELCVAGRSRRRCR